jgi:hypothetical protein
VATLEAILKTLKRRQVPLVLAFLTLVHLVVTLAWLRLDCANSDRVPDMFSHAMTVAHLLGGLELGGLDAAWTYLREINIYYPLVAHLPLLAAGKLVAPTWLTLRAANVVYVIILLVGIYKLGKQCHGRAAGLLAAAFVSLMPAVYGGWRTIGLDFPALCLTPLAIHSLLRSDGFRRLPQAALFGLFTGLAALVKGQTLLFIFCPACVVLARGLWNGWHARKEESAHLWATLRGAAAALCALSATTAFWWWGRLGYLIEIFRSHSSGEGMLWHEASLSVWGGLSCYLGRLPHLLGLPLLAGVLLVLPAFLRRCRYRWEIVAWIAPPIALHIGMAVRNPRYLFPLVPALALVLAMGMLTLRPRLRRIATPTVAILAVLAWLSCSFRPETDKSSPMLSGTCAKPSAPLALSTFMVCGDCTYAGPPTAPQVRGRLRRATRVMSRWLHRRHPRGRGAYIYITGEPDVTYAASILQNELPSLRIYLPLHPTYAPAHGSRRYVLATNPHHVTFPEATRVYEHRFKEPVFRAVTQPDDALSLWQLHSGAHFPKHLMPLLLSSPERKQR